MNISAGLYQVLILVDGYGFALVDSTVSVSYSSVNIKSNIALYSGSEFVIGGYGFDTTLLSANLVSVCGLQAKVKAVDE